MLCARRRRDGRPVQSLPSVDELLRTMDAAGVGRAVLLGWYWERAETCAWQNRFYAECVHSHPDRLMAFATVHPEAGREETLAEVRRASDAGLVGLGELSPHSQHYALDDWVFADVLTLAGELGLPVNLHVTDPAGRPYPGRVVTPLADFTKLARAFPQTKFILAHWGGLLPLVDSTANAATLPNVWYDTAASPLLYDAGIWSRALPVCGSDRVIFGSDHPLNLYPNLDDVPGMSRFLAEARAAGVPEAVLSGNLLGLLVPNAAQGRNQRC
jgi:predicted TIM-barrel fold metal-dependent hydrolase